MRFVHLKKFLTSGRTATQWPSPLRLWIYRATRSACRINLGSALVSYSRLTNIMSHHLFLLSPSDTPLYSLTHYSTKPVPSTGSALSNNLPTWSTSAFAGTLTALSGASSATQSHHAQGGSARMGGGQDRHVIQMIANASLDVVEEVMRKDNAMWV